jgi:thioester reductase-like protein
MQKKAVKINLGIAEELKKVQQMADKLEAQAKELAKNEAKATQRLKQASSLLMPIGNFQETQIEAMLSDLKSAGLESSAEYRELSSSYDFISRINATIKRMSSDVSKALN